MTKTASPLNTGALPNTAPGLKTTAPPPKSNLPILQTLALKIYSLLFFYIPNLPIKFNQDFSEIIVNGSPVQWIFAATSLTHLGIHGILSGLLAIYFGKFRKSKTEFGWERLIILTLLCCFFAGTAIFGYTVFKARNRLISSFNELLKIKRALTLSGNIQEKYGNFDKYGYAMLTTVFLSGLFTFGFTLAGLYMSFDAADYVFKKLLTNPAYWDTQTVYFTLVVRSIILFMSGVEISRSSALFLCCLCLLGDQGSKVIESLGNLKFPIFAHLYTILRIMHGKILHWFHWLIYLLVTTFFWGTVISSYCMIVCLERVTFIVYFAAVVSVLSCVLIQFILFPHCVDTMVLTRNVVVVQRTKVRTIRAKQKSFINFKNLKVAMGIYPIKILCGTFKIIDREFLTEHFELLLARLFDAIMIS